MKKKKIFNIFIGMLVVLIFGGTVVYASNQINLSVEDDFQKVIIHSSEVTLDFLYEFFGDKEIASRQFELVTNSNYEGMMSFIQNFSSDDFEVIPNLMQNTPVGDSIEPLKMGNISHSEDIQIQDINLGENDNVIVELN